MSDTPQTDAFAVKFKTLCGEKYWIPVDIARKLERERDEAMKKIEQQRKEIVRLNGATNHAGGTPLKIALRERDEAREAFVIATDQVVLAQSKLRETDKERQAFVIAQQEVITNLILEHNKALDKVINDLKNILR
jgi:hypothetical protein